MTTPKYPDVKVQLSGQDGNAFFIIGRCLRAAKGKMPLAEINAFQTEATSGDYNKVLQTAMKWFDIE